MPSDSAALPAKAALARADTIKTPTARPYTPRSAEIGANGWHWNREALFASGALTLGELLAFVPGVSLMSTGFILAPQVAAWYGDPGGVRVFVDGVELVSVNPRNGGLTDFALPPLFALEDVSVERAAGELRVHLRSWRVERTTPETSVHVLTGSENVNLYRGFLGNRLGNGGVIQLAAQQFSTQSNGGLDGDALGAMGRVGWARGSWSLDGTYLRQGASRKSGTRYLGLLTPVVQNAIPEYTGSESVAYLRAAWRDPEVSGSWAQVIVSQVGAVVSHASQSLGTAPAGGTPGTLVDTTAVRAQYILSAGLSRWGLRLSSTTRVRPIRGTTYVAPGARVEYDSRLLTVSAFGERGVDSTTRTDMIARLAPFRWFNVGGAVSRATPKSLAVGPAVTASRVEAGLMWHDRWVTGGVVRGSATRLRAPVELDSAVVGASAPAAMGTFASFRGPLLFGWGLDVDLINWDSAGYYRPKQQARSRLWFESSFLKTFPRGNFHLAVSGTYDYRAATRWPPGTVAPSGTAAAALLVPPSTIYSTLLEIRIGTAVLTWQNRNLLGTVYQTYPGYVMPRLTNIYGLRWDFRN